MIIQQMPLYKYVESRVIILHQPVSITPMAIMRVSYNTKTINVQIILKKIVYNHLMLRCYKCIK